MYVRMSVALATPRYLVIYVYMNTIDNQMNTDVYMVSMLHQWLRIQLSG